MPSSAPTAVDTLDKGRLLEALDALRRGDFSHRLPLDWEGIDGRISDAFNSVITVNQCMADELERLRHEVGKEGKIQERATVGTLTGSWAASMRSVNALIDDVVQPISETARVIGAVAKGDLSQSMTLSIDGRPVKGEFLRTAKTVNTMVNQLGSFASEVTRVAREVGTEGKLGGQAKVQGVAGTWKDLTDNVNLMASNLTSQVRNIATVTTAVARGDLTKKITVDVKGEILELKDTINTMVDQLSSFASEVTRVAREVGTEGKLGGQADVPGVAGTWKDLTDNVNSMGSNLTDQVRNIAEVATAIASGDLSKKITVDVKGEILELKSTINTMVDQLNAFASEVTRVAREVGTEGKLGGQADVPGVAGTWKDLTDNVNSMASNLTAQVRNIATVTTAVANGDLSKKITVNVKGEILELKDTINTMVDQLNAFASEVTRVAREVGTEGKLGGQADVPGVAGTWKDLTDNVNSMGSNLTGQVRNIAEVATAIASGDLSKKITVDVKGEILELKSTINTMVDQLNAFASEVTRVAREVGTEGKLGGQADVPGVAGTWKDLTDNVNSMAGNLTDQVRNIATVTTAVANGDLSKTITVDAKGEILELKSTINTMVDQLNAFASEVTRVAREVGTEGKLGGQADVPGVAGTWKDLTDNVNSMAGNLTGQVRNIAEVATAIANGDLSEKITVDVKGEILQLKDTINTMVDQLRSFASEVTRVAREVGTEGKLGGQADVPGVAGTWKDLTDNVNSMANNLTSQVRNIADVTKAVAAGDLSKQITVDVKGEILELKDTINTMVDQLSSFAAEVTRVARDVGTEGKLGGQAMVKGVSGTWKDLTDNVNSMASNLTSQVRGIARVVTAVANGDLKRKLTVEAKGEIAALAETINNMTDTLAIFADQVTTVAREVGVEGKLGGQAKVPGAAGTWKDLTENVNQLAANLTTQVRAIADVATAVTKGDLTRSISVAAEGEVAALKDTINEMILNLKDTTIKNNDQDWLKTNLAKFSRMLQGQKDLLTVGKRILSELAPVVSAQHAMFYIVEGGKDEEADPRLNLLASYAYSGRRTKHYRLGESLVGQCALEKERILLENVPEDYIKVSSGLGKAVPRSIMVLPVLFEGRIKGVMELASFERFSPTHEMFLAQLTESIGIVINTIEANMRTEALLKQSQSLANELQEQQQELQKTNQELEEKAELLADQNVEVERKNHEVEQARSALEEKARQLALTSKYKSEFLANMSHELRTPLNSLLILSDQLARNQIGNLTTKQVEYARTIQSSGQDLLSLINDILDLSKIESGTVTLEIGELNFQTLRDHVERTFRHVAEAKALDFEVCLAPDLPDTVQTDCKRLQQVLKNLLSNAFKFTNKGRVEVRIDRAPDDWIRSTPTLRRADEVLCFMVSDSGIGIQPDKQQTIFEAFQQADGSTSRKYGGTGLGLAISREISHMLGGEIQLESAPGKGSIFTLYLPRIHAPPKTQRIQGPVVPTLPAPELEQVDLSGDESVIAVTPQVIDDRNELLSDEANVLIVDNDSAFAGYIRDIAHEHDLKAVITPTGCDAFALAVSYRPLAVILDIKLLDMDGWRVLDHLKGDLVTRHIPVHVVSNDEHALRAYRHGAISSLVKPVTREQLVEMVGAMREYARHSHRRLLVVDSDRNRWQRWDDLLRCQVIRLEFAESLEQGLSKPEGEGCFDAILLVEDEVEQELAGANFHRQSQAAQLRCPLVVCMPEQMDSRETLCLPEVRAVVTLGPGGEDCLVDQVAAALHLPHRELPEDKQAVVERLHQPEHILAGKRVLVVDDDIRNIFAMSSVLERYDVQVLSAENGLSAIEVLSSQDGIDCVLMDIMMPEMDGYDTMRVIRSKEQFSELPIIALTAKAMKGDREKCIAAGASDYIAKPVDTDRLLSLLCLWLYRGVEA